MTEKIKNLANGLIDKVRLILPMSNKTKIENAELLALRNSILNPPDPNYEPVWNRHFYCDIHGINNHLVESFSAPHMSLNSEGKLMSYGKPIMVGLIQTVGSKIYQTVYQQIKESQSEDYQGHDLRVKQIDSLGNIITESVYKNAKITALQGLNSLRYDELTMSKLTIFISFSECIVES